MKRFVLTFLFFLTWAYGSNPLTLTGVVRHANTYREIDNAYIYLKDIAIGTISDKDGTFHLTIPDSLTNPVVVFEHIAYDTLHIVLAEALKQKSFYLSPRVLQADAISVMAFRELPEIFLDIPHAYSTIPAELFENRGYIDAGDLLRTNQTIQVKEKLSGEKTATIRAGNADDVLVLYNGIKLNSLFDNVSDLSVINLDEVKQFEIIRGSNTSLFGPEAFSGIINIVPLLHKNYTLRFRQKIGSYASGDWALQLHHSIKDRASLSYSFKRGATKRIYSLRENSDYLQNKQSNHFASLYYNLGSAEQEHALSMLYLYSNLDYYNTRYLEKLGQTNQLLSVQYSGQMSKNLKIKATTAYKSNLNRHNLKAEMVESSQHFLSRSYQLRVNSIYDLSYLSLVNGAQIELGRLDYRDVLDDPQLWSTGLESAIFERSQYGLVSIIKMHIPTKSKFIKLADIDLSYRFDGIKNQLQDVQLRTQESHLISAQLADQDWQVSTYKFSTFFAGNNSFFEVNSYLNYGSNIKFPTMYRQISAPRLGSSSQPYAEPDLNPEQNKSLELGIEFGKENHRENPVSGWRLSFNYFQNLYQNKFRTYYMPGTPIAFYDNVPNADITGLEFNIKTFFLSSKLRLEGGLSHYAVSDKAAFPLKSEWKYISNLFIDHWGYTFQAHAFMETEQIAWIRSQQGQFWEVTLPRYLNLDLHLSKFIDVGAFRFAANASVRNLVRDDTELEGLALRDRRYYLSFSVQY